MKIEIELGFSHIRDSIVMIDRALARFPNDNEAISLKHLRNALIESLPKFNQELVAIACGGYVCDGKKFKSLAAANKHAAKIFRQQNIVVAVEVARG